jgi:hypothetical protein
MTHVGFTSIAMVLALTVASCADPERERLKATTKATYDTATGKLTELTSDANKNGRIDTWTEMDGARPVRSRIDTNEDGKIDRWEYYDQNGRLTKVGLSRRNGDKPDAWAYSTPDGKIARVEVSSTADEQHIDRWELYDAAGALTRIEEDTNHDGRPDKWERYETGALATAEFDQNGDGRPDRRLTYRDAELVLIETAPDASGTYTRKVQPGR